MPVTDLDLAAACQSTYSGGTPAWGTDVTHVFLYECNGTHIVAFEGTTDAQEWLIDFEAVPVDERGFNHADLGLVHLGWWNDVSSVADAIITTLKQLSTPVACTGHSKGAGEALIFAALAKTQGIVWERVSTFGTPHPGGLNGLITSADGSDYRNVSNPPDPVCGVPFYLPRPRPLTLVQAPLPQWDMPHWEMAGVSMESHHIQNYIGAMKGHMP